ncbi:DNA-binding protein [Salarchaeum sp. JOR-1]|uniref:DNA-binding protein n=1 Tax=Salarchaeum sp. JOR-1 TaxID=2599399 RepID=UPI0011985872|nr:DNA-binding protein [Salarchaeum sp. JOR-1]QDX41165.1 DNA-binding protein [Salarchaeum sp. JOR-1]
MDALAAAIDAFNEEGYGVPTREDAINSDADWKTQLTKACRLLTAVDTLSDQGFYTATIELCFGATERSVEAYALAEGGDDLEDFHDHTTCYDRATALGLLFEPTTRDLRQLYDTNRTDSYYGGWRPTARQAETMQQLARSVHEYVTDQIREGGVCVCDSLD